MDICPHMQISRDGSMKKLTPALMQWKAPRDILVLHVLSPVHFHALLDSGTSVDIN